MNKTNWAENSKEMTETRSRKWLDHAAVKRILIRATNWVGDAVMSLPALEAVSDIFPDAAITVFAKPWVVPIYKAHPGVDHVLVYHKDGRGVKNLKTMMRAIIEIRRQRFDLAILFQNAFEAALLSYLGGVKFRLGYNTDGRGLLLTHAVMRDSRILNIHQTEYYLSILRAMGWEARSRNPRITVSREDIKTAGELLESLHVQREDFLVGLSPGAIYGGAKRWPEERFARIGDLAAENWGAKIIIMGTPKEQEIAQGVCEMMTRKPINLCGKTNLGRAIGVISLCRFFVTNDSGLMHIAAALGIPTVAIFGSTDAVTTSPKGPRTRIVRREVECSPCLKKECPTDHRCMLSIDPEEVWREMNVLRGEHVP